MRGITAAGLLAVVACAQQTVRQARDSTDAVARVAAPPCAPIDGAWALQMQVVDAATERPVRDAGFGQLLSSAVSDSNGWGCIRDFGERVAAVEVWRRGYVDTSLHVEGMVGTTHRQVLRLPRVATPCCDLRGDWALRLELEEPSKMHPQPTGRVVTGPVRIGAQHLPPDEGDDLDSLVVVRRGLHELDLSPFFGGPYARDVSTTVFGGGATLFREVSAEATGGDSVRLVIIPRMSHGGLTLSGIVRGDTIVGGWFQNAYCCGAVGRFLMWRTAPPDTAADVAARARAPQPTHMRRLRVSDPVALTAAGTLPPGRWRPHFAVSPNGALWLAPGGLFVADSFGAPWTRVLGGPEDGVAGDELRIGIGLAFVGEDTVVVALDDRYHSPAAPKLYRSTDRGRRWTAVPQVRIAQGAVLAGASRHLWAGGYDDEAARNVLFRSDDGGARWRKTLLPPDIRTLTALHPIDDTTAYLSGSGRNGSSPALWYTADGGARWQALRTPRDVGLHDVSDGSTRIEQLVAVGDWLVVREHGRVFSARRPQLEWRAHPEWDYVAGDPGRRSLLVLLRSGHVTLLDAALQPRWTTTARVEIPRRDGVEHLVLQGDVGYAVLGDGALYRVHAGRLSKLARRAAP